MTANNGDLEAWEILQRDYGQSPYSGILDGGGPSFGTTTRGYEVWYTNKKTDGTRDVPVHQLLAINKGNDPNKVFSGNDYQVHHKNEIPWDNRPENIELLSHEDHAREHARRKWDTNGLASWGRGER